MANTAPVTKFYRSVVVQLADKSATAGLLIGSTSGVGVPAAGILAYDTTLAAWVSRAAGTSGTAAALPFVPIAQGIIAVAAGSTSGTATVPAGLSLATNRISYGVAGSATTAVVTSAPLFTLSGTTLTCTVIDPGGATTLYVSYAIYPNTSV